MTAGNPPCILLVDDDDAMRDVVAFELRKFGCLVVQARSAAAALIGARDLPFDLVLTDFHMPGRNGLELLADLRSLYPNLPVVLMSGGGTISQETATADGANAFLTKPFSVEDLRSVLTKLLDSQQDRSRIEPA